MRSSITTVADPPASLGWRQAISVYLELAKARLATMVVITTAVGYVLAARGATRPDVLLWTVVGTALTAFGANILNQWWEVERDRRMPRTRNRPIPSGRIDRHRAGAWGLASAIVGITVLALGSTWLTAVLGLGNVLLYVVVYTPLKVRSPLNTVVGAVCGAVPPMMGWAAATGQLETGAWILGGLLFVWQIPHFLALAWMYRDDYARGGFRMLPAVDPDGGATGRLATVHAAALLPLCLLASWTGVSGTVFLGCATLLTLLFTFQAAMLASRRTATAARRLFLVSLLYLPVLLGVMVADMDDRVLGGAFLGHQPTPPTLVAASAPIPDAEAAPRP